MDRPAVQDQTWGLPPWAGALVGVGVGIAYGIFAAVLVKLSGANGMGTFLFILFPVVIGAAIGFATPRPLTAVALLAAGVALIICLLTLIAARAEGLLCALIAFPLIFIALGIGVVVGVVVGSFVRGMLHDRISTGANCVILFLAPLLAIGGQRWELTTFTGPRTELVTTTMHLDAKPDEVWRNIQSLDKLEGRKSMLMYLGLPIPQRCELKGTSVGSKRICYFDQGSIEESVLEWDPPHRMRLAVDRTNMTGRHWLAFDGAEYDLQGDATGTVIIRVTTIRSNLRPAWYWARFERWGVESEHEYLFSDLAKRFPERR